MPASPALARRTLLFGLTSLGTLALSRPLRAQSGPPPAGGISKLADLRRLGPESASPSPLFVVNAFTPDDEGGGWFVWRANSKIDDDDGCVVAPDATKPGRWHRVFSGPVDARWFGAHGDGKQDDGSAIQRAVDHHADIYLPAGVYRLTAPIDLTKQWGRRLSGAGQAADPGNANGFDKGRLSLATTLLLDAGDAPVLRLAGSGNVVERLCLMAKIRQSRDNKASYGIELQGVSRSRLSDLRIFNCATGIGLPQKALARDGRSNWMFDSTLSNIDINGFSRCGLDLRNYQGGGTGVVLSQIYMANMAEGGTQANGTLYEADHFILGQNWAEYVLQAVHCEWTRCRDIPIQLANCNATIAGLHLEGLRFAQDVAAIIRTEGGNAGLSVDAVQLYNCLIEGGPSTPPLPLAASAAKTARLRLSSIMLSRTNASEGGRKLTAARILGGDANIVLNGLIQESNVYLPPAPTQNLTVSP
jgi:hypothetical protein